MKELAKGKLSTEDEATIQTGECPACGSKKWIIGPQGCNSLNVACSQGHRFWVAGGFVKPDGKSTSIFSPFTPEYQGIIKVEDHGDGTYRAWF